MTNYKSQMTNDKWQCAVRTFAIAVIFTSLSLFSAEPSPAERESQHLKHIRRLTFAGSKNGEAYFSPNGKEIVFQGVREPGNPFYQIYRMDLATGITNRVSPGIGKTTCSFFHPTKNRILFASTHLDPQAVDKQKEEIEKLKAGPPKRYAWPFDAEMDIFESDPDGKNLVRLTDAKGYDAECDYSPDGSKIVFCSTRDGDGTLNDGEIYIMDADGKNQTRLTNEKGYDGGPFFSPDGKKILWRHFEDAEQKVAEVWTMNIDGSDKKQVTKLRALSWAPYYHPSMKWIVFASNFEDPGFELYLIRPDGTDLTRLTYSQGFDGLPVFSADGKKLMWTSNRFESRSHIVIADVILPGEAPPPAPIFNAGDYFTDPKMLARVRDLREAGNEFRIDHAVAKQFREAGLLPFIKAEAIDDTLFIYGPRITGWIPAGKQSSAVIVAATQMKHEEGLAFGVATLAETIRAQSDARKNAKNEKLAGIYCTASSPDDIETIYTSAVGDLKKPGEERPLKITAALSALRLGNMRGRTLYLHGAGTSTGWCELAERLAAEFPSLEIAVEESPEKAPELKQFTDHKVPALAFAGADTEVPMIGDDAAPPFDVNAIDCAAAAYERALALLASGEVKVDFMAYDPVAAKAAADALKRPYLGTVPDFGGAGINGVKLSDVRDASPAQKAGLQKGDVIIGLAGKDVGDVKEYLNALEGLKVGEETTIKYVRAGKIETVKITPGAK